MTNPVLQAMHEQNLSEVEGMNLLQDHGVISDNCVWVDDIHVSDHAKAIEFLKAHQQDRGR